MIMPGIEFLMDCRGRRTAVLIDLNKHGGLWEALFDTYRARHRLNEPRDSLSKVKKSIEAKAKREARG